MSNFAVIQSAPPNTLVPMIGTLVEIGATKLNIKQKPFCACKITDTAGVTRSATINSGNSPLPTADMLGKQCRWNISTYAGKSGVAFSGFFAGIATNAQMPLNYVPPQPQQAPQLAPQSQKSPQVVKPPIDNNTYIVAECAAIIVGEWVTGATIKLEQFDWEIIRVANAIWGAAVKLQHWKPMPEPQKTFTQDAEDIDAALGQEPPKQEDTGYTQEYTATGEEIPF